MNPSMTIGAAIITHPSAKQIRIVNVFRGLCAGDRNGGPQRMALRIAEVALQQHQQLQHQSEKTINAPQQQKVLVAGGSGTDKSGNNDHDAKCPRPLTPALKVPFAREILIGVYMSWLVGGMDDQSIRTRFPFLQKFEPEPAFDAGAVYDTVFGAAQEEIFRESKDESANVRTLSEAVSRAAKYAFDKNPSAGVSPSHRNVVFACCPWLTTFDDIASHSAAETTITHLHAQSIDTAIATNIIARGLIDGRSLLDSVKLALKYLTEDIRDPLVVKVLSSFISECENTALQRPHHKGGHSPYTLAAALYFLHTHNTFKDALVASLQFAGPSNYCPVLVGSLGGALFEESEDGDIEQLLQANIMYLRERVLWRGSSQTQCENSDDEGYSHRQRVLGVANAIASFSP